MKCELIRRLDWLIRQAVSFFVALFLFELIGPCLTLIGLLLDQILPIVSCVQEFLYSSWMCKSSRYLLFNDLAMLLLYCMFVRVQTVKHNAPWLQEMDTLPASARQPPSLPGVRKPQR